MSNWGLNGSGGHGEAVGTREKQSQKVVLATIEEELERKRRGSPDRLRPQVLSPIIYSSRSPSISIRLGRYCVSSQFHHVEIRPVTSNEEKTGV